MKQILNGLMALFRTKQTHVAPQSENFGDWQLLQTKAATNTKTNQMVILYIGDVLTFVKEDKTNVYFSVKQQPTKSKPRQGMRIFRSSHCARILG